jgi:hypothetical protein
MEFYRSLRTILFNGRLIMHRIVRPAFLLLCSGIALVPASAVECVSCGPGGECYTASPGFSANCECRIRSISGTAICKPSGVCDPSDSTSCDGDPWVNVSPGEEVSTAFLTHLGEKDSLAAGAVWGALTEGPAARGKVIRSHLAPGEYAGTMGKDGRSYTYRTRVRQLAAGSWSLAIAVEEDGTGGVQEYEGVLRERGKSGTVVRVGKEGRARVASWRSRHHR